MITLKDILHDNSFKMVLKEKSIYINNFKKMNILEDNHIYLDTKNKKIHIYGKKLKTKKILETEILLTGIIEKIEVINES